MENPKNYIDQDKPTVEREVVSQIQARIEQHLREDGANFTDLLGSCEVIMDGEGGVWCRHLGEGLQPTLQVFFDDGPIRWTAGYTLQSDQEIRPDAETGHYVADESGAFVRQLLDALDAPVIADEAIVLEPLGPLPNRPKRKAQKATAAFDAAQKISAEDRFTDDLHDEQKAAARNVYNELEAILEPREEVKIGNWDCAMNEEETIILAREGERVVLKLFADDFSAAPKGQDWVAVLAEIKEGIGAHLLREGRDGDRMSAARDIYNMVDGMLRPGKSMQIGRWEIQAGYGIMQLRSGLKDLRLWLNDDVFGASPANHDWIATLAQLNAAKEMAMREKAALDAASDNVPDRAKMAAKLIEVLDDAASSHDAFKRLKVALNSDFYLDFDQSAVIDFRENLLDAINSFCARIVMKHELGSISLEAIMDAAGAGTAAPELGMAAIGRRLYKLIVAAMDEGLITGNGWGAEYRDSTCTTITVGDHGRPTESLSLDEDGSVAGTWLEGGDLLALAGRIAADLGKSLPVAKVVSSKSVEEFGEDLTAALKAMPRTNVVRFDGNVQHTPAVKNWSSATHSLLDPDFQYTKALKVIAMITNYSSGKSAGTGQSFVHDAILLDSLFSDREALLEEGLLDEIIQVFTPALVAGWEQVRDKITFYQIHCNDGGEDKAAHIGFLFDRITSVPDAVAGVNWMAEDWRSRTDVRSQTVHVEGIHLAFDEGVRVELWRQIEAAERVIYNYSGALKDVRKEAGDFNYSSALRKEDGDHGK